MIRFTSRFWIVIALCISLMTGYAVRAQTEAPDPVQSPDSPESATPVPPVPPEPDQSHIRRHRFNKKGEVRVEISPAELEAAVAKLRANIDRLEAELERLKDAGEEERASTLEQHLQLLQQQLELLELQGELDPTELERWGRNGDLPIIITPGGEAIVINPPDAPRARRVKDDMVAIFEPVYVDEDEAVQGIALSIFDDVHVNGHVDDDVVSIGGNVYIDGSVAGNVVAPFGDVFLSENAYVKGDVVAIEVFDDQGYIGGKIEEVNMVRIPWAGGGARSFYALASTVAVSLALLALLLGLLVQTAAMPNVQRTEERLRAKPVASFFGGMLVELLAFPVWLILVVTVIGIPVALLGLPLIMLAAKLLGFVALSRIIGRAILRPADGERSPWAIYMMGAALLFAPLIIGASLRLTAGESFLVGPFSFIGTLAVFIGLSALYIGGTVGMGAAVFSRLGTRSLKPDARPVGTTPPPRGTITTAESPGTDSRALPDPPGAGTAPDAT